jgi:hypothetical protein
MKLIKTSVMSIIALLAWFGLVLQFYLMIKTALQSNTSIPAEILRFFSYFTILTNLLVAACLTTVLISPGSRWGKFFSRSSVQSAIALYIGVVGLVYIVALRHIWNPQGLQLVADGVLHYMVPFLYVLYWIFLSPGQTLQWRHALVWLIYPACYLIYVLIRGALMNVYPYYFLDKNHYEWSRIIINISILIAVFAVLGFLLVGITRLFKSDVRSS